MLSKLLKNDLKKNMRWMWILFVSTITLAGITRGLKELGKNIAFFKMAGIFFEGIYYGIAINSIIQPFLRNFLNFHKSFYSDEAYLTHTLPVTKNQLINSKYLTFLIEILCGFASLVISLLIMYAGPNFINTARLLISSLVTEKISLGLSLTLIITLVIVEFLMFISIIDFAIVMGFKSRDRRILKSFLITIGCSFAAGFVLLAIMLIILSINGIQFTSSTLILSKPAFYSIMIAGIITYSLVIAVFYFLTKHHFNKGVNVD
ncbi:MAG: hypothetical protein IKJ33_03065 [Clostridia bacterium]|nr:hypothetical protein [Clostridia bacterium]